MISEKIIVIYGEIKLIWSMIKFCCVNEFIKIGDKSATFKIFDQIQIVHINFIWYNHKYFLHDLKSFPLDKHSQACDEEQRGSLRGRRRRNDCR